MVVGRRVHVDDRAPHRDLAPRLHLVLAPVAAGDQPGDELVAVDLVAGPHDDGLDLLDVRAEPLHQRAHRRHDDLRAAGPVDRAAATCTRRRRPIVSNDGDTRSNGSVSHAGKSSTSPAPRNCPRSRHQALGLGAGRHREQQRPAGRDPGERRDEQRPGGVGHRHRRLRGRSPRRSAGSSARSGARAARGGVVSAMRTGCTRTATCAYAGDSLSPDVRSATEGQRIGDQVS